MNQSINTRRGSHGALAYLLRFTTGSMIYAIGIGLQFVAVVVLARLLGPTEFGKYSIYAAICLIATEVLALGSGDVMTRGVAIRPRRFAALYGHSLIVGALALIPCTLGLTIAMLFYGLVPAHVMLIATIGAIEIGAGRIAALGEQAFISRLQPSRANMLRLLVNALRAAAAFLVLLLLPDLDLLDWLIIQAVCSAIAALLTILVINRLLGPPRLLLLGNRIAVGLPFSATQVLRMAQQQADRLLIGLVATPEVVGVYAAASRVVSLGSLPMVTLLRMTYPGFFVHGAKGMRNVLPLGLRLLAGLLAVASATVAVFYFAAPFLPWLLGEAYRDAVLSAQLLAPICFAYAFQHAGGNLLSGAGRQGLRLVATALNLLCIIGGILLFGGSGGPIAIVVAVLVGNFIGAAAIWFFVLVTWLRDTPADNRGQLTRA